VERHEDCAVLESVHTVYITEQSLMSASAQARQAIRDRGGRPADRPGLQLHLQRGDVIHLVADGVGHDALPARGGARAKPATIACTLPEALLQARKGHRIWFDDGRIGGVVRSGCARAWSIEITQARLGGEKLAADKGINLPDTPMQTAGADGQGPGGPAGGAKLADLVGLSFCQSAQDVQALQRRMLGRLRPANLGIVLKIETRRGFEHLPEMLLAAMKGPPPA
jgi:pyruvate kinase